MNCAACAARIEKAVSAVEGVESCAVSLLTNEMGVEGHAAETAVISAVKAAGYGASVQGGAADVFTETADTLQDPLADMETPRLKRRLFASLAFLLALMYISMGHMMFSFPLPAFLADNCIFMAISELVLCVTVLVINRRFFINGFKGLVHGAPNMDTLVAMGSGAGFVYSLFSLYRIICSARSGDVFSSASYMGELYFESSAMILALITVGKTLEARAKGKTTDALRSLIRLTPKTALVLRDGVESEILASEVRIGDVFVVYAGQSVPVDGVVTEGAAAVNESAMTGESVPVDKAPGDAVSAGTINASGFLRCRAVAVGRDTAISRIIRLVSDAAATKAPIAKTADRVSAVFVPVVISIAAVTTIIWLLSGQSTGFALARGISVLVISCPCALGLATPVAIMVASGKGARNGILFKTAAALEEAGRVKTVVLDKTGTVTLGEMHVTDVIPAPGESVSAFLSLALGLEEKSSHPLAKAVAGYVRSLPDSAPPAEVEEFSVLPGNGVSALVSGKMCLGGSVSYVTGEGIQLPLQIAHKADELAAAGKTVMLFSSGDKFAGLMAVADVIRQDSAPAIKELKSLGIRVIMLTGDNERTAAAVGAAAGVDEVIAGVLPDGKEAVIRGLMSHGKTAMVGDGINDAPALTRADVGIAIGAGADVAVDSADVVLVRSSLSDAVAAVKLGRAALRNIKENLFWAFFYNSIGIPIAAGALYGLGVTLNPMIAAACMSLSSFCVVTNALRLNFVNLYSGQRTAEISSDKSKENEIMTKTLYVEGMMCPHCEARVKKALEAVSGVISAEASFEAGTAVVLCNDAVSPDALVSAVTAQDYKVTGIK